MKPKRFEINDIVTYKSKAECGGNYHCGGMDKGGLQGIVMGHIFYSSEDGCYQIEVTIPCEYGGNNNSRKLTKWSKYAMLESEFEEYDK